MPVKMTATELNRRFEEGGRRAIEVMCPRCQETRLLTVTLIHGRAAYFCDVCAKSWDR